MELLVNDLSINGQFLDLNSFRGAISRVMTMRETARRFGRELHCHRNIAHAQVTQEQSMEQAIQIFDLAQRRSVMQWLTRYGPFWEDTRGHSPDDYLECNDKVVTDTAVGEAAWNCINGIDRRLVSLTPSSWAFSPVPVDLVENTGNRKSVDVLNYWELATLETNLRAAPRPIVSWTDLAHSSHTRCPNLTFSADSFEPLRGHPFHIGAVYRIIELLDTLDKFKTCFDAHGQRTPEGHRLYQDHFTGDKAWFSDSSETEKQDFKKQLTFHHPAIDRETLFCTWHGKVKIQQLRIHFSWPVRADESLYIVYVGPKITKR